MQENGVDSDSRLIVVLAHPRTGSSLLMQTLKLLGAEVVGSLMREDLPPEANPKGYFEEKEILWNGMTDEAIDQVESAQGDRIAFKVALIGMLRPERLEQWRYWRERRATILVPVRHPLETALSRGVFRPKKASSERFIFITRFLWKYRHNFRDLASILIDEVPELLPQVHVVPHVRVREAPERYIERVAAMAGLAPDAQQISSALANIDPSLYRYRLDDFDQEYRNWDKQIGASKLYELLLNEAQPWPLIHAMERAPSADSSPRIKAL